MLSFNKIYSDGVITIRKYENNKESNVYFGPKQLINFLKKNENLIGEFEKVSGIKFSDLNKFDSNRNEITLSDLKLFIKLNEAESIESKINDSPFNNCQIVPKLYLTSWDEPASGPLEIKSGENKLIPPGSVLHFSKLVIEENGKLTINNGRQGVTQIKSDGDCIINGNIESKNFRSGTSPGRFEETSPDGDIISIPIQEENLGGRGGRGGFGSYKSCIGYPSPVGGSGALGTSQFGGGGGGSGYVTLVAVTDDPTKMKCEGYKGYDAIGQIGGKSDGASAFGGSGGGRTPMKNGGYLFLKCGGKIVFSKTSKLDFSGSSGTKGDDGGINCGGGGGGGPGGQGGYLVVNHQIDDMSAIDNFSGGTGGNGGLKGKSRQFCSSGEDGLPGETGFSGSILFSN